MTATIAPVDLANGYEIYDVHDVHGRDLGRVWRHPRMRGWKADDPYGHTARRRFRTERDAAQWLADLQPPLRSGSAP